MRVETTPQVQANRKSVRIMTQETFNGTLAIMDSIHVPTGCATWPAFWALGPNWPYGGEIDIVEGANDYGFSPNQATLHTGPGCSMPSGSTAASIGFTGTYPTQSTCNSLTTANQGCGIISKDANSFGKQFNDNGGGVYASESYLFFTQNSITDAVTVQWNFKYVFFEDLVIEIDVVKSQWHQSVFFSSKQYSY